MLNQDKCHNCENYLHGLERCKFCSYQFDDSLAWNDNSKWDIFEIDDEIEWSFLQIQYRLKAHGIDCLEVINWCPNDNVIVIFGVKSYPEKVAEVLGVHRDSIVSDSEIGIMVINLFMEKYFRGELK